MFETTTVLTLHLAKALGLYMVAAGLSGLVSHGRWQRWMADFGPESALTYVTGVVAFAIGTAIIIAHTIWSSPLAVMVTLVGWAALIEGLVLIAFPDPLVRFGTSLARPGISKVFAVVSILIGAFLLLGGLIGRAGL
ncbi:DUF2065 domain-containing protein [Aquisalinus flavus]|uniref:DUF2065 domain-containing protein n=1 Tax=Aquisalinus flavus TaxID=1526572 RepID=A0A8J2V127_9PROT|nr:DUF2065 domain-containing protein [Aquisalinus flavus]MBD0427125.1 DUF2065 domain-containing protein [Aquisalinus flavus]UNE46946.1 DUF2065 domain-containing protein [Aquisalinus flavus]GGC98573.1 hypothetical protein GCM10011342_04390 [Aquisalinus flavus]